MGNWERFVWDQRADLLSGLLVTLDLCAHAFAAALFGGLALCLLRLYVPVLRPIATLLIFCISWVGNAMSQQLRHRYGLAA